MALPIGLSKYQDELKKILLEVARVLEREKVTYYLAYGTLLGSLRHGDVIPWDDDIDIMVPRREYERALSILRRSCPTLFVWDWATDEKCCYEFAKVFSRIHSGQTQESYCAYIDIYPLDAIPHGKIRQYFVRITSTAFRRLINRKSKSPIQYQTYTLFSCMFYCLGIPFSWCSIRTLRRCYEKVLGDGRETGLVLHEKQILPQSWFKLGRRGSFGGQSYSIPFEAEKILKAQYGDWENCRLSISAQVMHI